MAVEHCPDVVLMDIAMPVLNGMEATRRSCPNTRVIGLSIYDNPGMDEMMLAAGAAAYVTTGADGSPASASAVSKRRRRQIGFVADVRLPPANSETALAAAAATSLKHAPLHVRVLSLKPSGHFDRHMRPRMRREAAPLPKKALWR